ILQETFVAAWEGVARFDDRGPGSLVRWACSLAENRIRRAVRSEGALRRDARRTVGGEPARAALALTRDAGTGPCTSAARSETRSRLSGAVALLSNDERAVLLGRVVEGRTWPDLAQELGCSETAARRLASKAAVKVGEILERKGAIQ
ncbi:MAG: sigma-70 family RNA polymerase sigma factor, partial [Planctomycetota bacterium]